MKINSVYYEDNLRTMNKMPNDFVDLVITSPPYEDIRDYKGFHWNFQAVALELFRIIRYGGVLVWVVGDKTVNGTEQLTPFRHAIFMQDFVGFNTWDTMIFMKDTCPFPANVRYNQMFEFMYIFSKGKPKTFNPLKELKSPSEIEKINKNQIKMNSTSYRNKNGETIRSDSDSRVLNRLRKSSKNIEKTKGNVWLYKTGYLKSSPDKIAYEHPATFPEQLAHDHIVSWSNPGDLIYDPFAGSGTVGIVSQELNRNFILSEISDEYCDIIKRRFQNRFKLDIPIYR